MRSGPIQAGERICVTGANGFIASWLIRDLLAAGFVVRGTVRDPHDTEKTAHLQQIAREVGATDRFELVAADLMVPGSFDAAFADCVGIVHAAASVVFNHKDPQRGIVDPSVVGTRNVLDSAKKVGCVRRMVHTSSMAAVYRFDAQNGHVFTEADWNTTSTLANDPYGLAKVEAERTARAYVDTLDDADKWELVHLNPGMVFGPPLIKAHAKASPKLVRDVLSRAQPGVPRIMLSVVDVRDVAHAHIAALTADAPPKRCLVFAENAWMTELMSELQSQFPDIRMGTMHLPKPLVLLAGAVDPTLNVRQLWHIVGRALPMDNQLGRTTLGLRYRPVSETLRDTATPMVEHGWARVRRRSG